MSCKLHIERPATPGLLFGIMPALCGRKRPTDYRMFPPDDAVRERATRPFFAENPKRATCETCKAAYAQWLYEHGIRTKG